MTRLPSVPVPIHPRCRRRTKAKHATQIFPIVGKGKIETIGKFFLSLPSFFLEKVTVVNSKFRIEDRERKCDKKVYNSNLLIIILILKSGTITSNKFSRKERKQKRMVKRRGINGETNWWRTIGAHGCLTLHARLFNCGPLIAACPSFARNFHRGGGKQRGLGRGVATNGEQCRAQRGWIIFHGFAYNSAALAMRSLFPDGDPCATPVRCACDGRGKSRNGIFQPVVDLFFLVLFRFVRFLRHVWFKILRYE